MGVGFGPGRVEMMVADGFQLITWQKPPIGFHGNYISGQSPMDWGFAIIVITGRACAQITYS